MQLTADCKKKHRTRSLVPDAFLARNNKFSISQGSSSWAGRPVWVTSWNRKGARRKCSTWNGTPKLCWNHFSAWYMDAAAVGQPPETLRRNSLSCKGEGFLTGYPFSSAYLRHLRKALVRAPILSAPSRCVPTMTLSLKACSRRGSLNASTVVPKDGRSKRFSMAIWKRACTFTSFTATSFKWGSLAWLKATGGIETARPVITMLLVGARTGSEGADSSRITGLWGFTDSLSWTTAATARSEATEALLAANVQTIATLKACSAGIFSPASYSSTMAPPDRQTCLTSMQVWMPRFWSHTLTSPGQSNRSSCSSGSMVPLVSTRAPGCTASLLPDACQELLSELLNRDPSPLAELSKGDSLRRARLLPPAGDLDRFFIFCLCSFVGLVALFPGCAGCVALPAHPPSLVTPLAESGEALTLSNPGVTALAPGQSRPPTTAARAALRLARHGLASNWPPKGRTGTGVSHPLFWRDIFCHSSRIPPPPQSC